MLSKASASTIPKKVDWRDFIFRARGRDLKGAIFDFASVPRVDFTGANLQSASLDNAQLDHVSFEKARLQNASLEKAKLKQATLEDADSQAASFDGAELQGASLNDAHLQVASFEFAKLQGTSRNRAQLQGASFDGAQLQGASLDGAQVQGASLNGANFQGASLGVERQRDVDIGHPAELQGASLELADLRGASLSEARLQGATLGLARLEATDLSNALLWRSDARNLNPTLPPEPPRAVLLDGWKTIPLLSDPLDFRNVSSMWLPVSEDNGDYNATPWNSQSYQRLRATIKALPPGSLHDEALRRIEVLDCGGLPGACDDANVSFAAAKWRQILEAASVGYNVYIEVLAKTLKDLLCSGGDSTIYIVRGVSRSQRSVHQVGRLEAAGAAAIELLNDLTNKDSKDCPVSALLTDADRTNLLALKQRIEATKEARKQLIDGAKKAAK